MNHGLQSYRKALKSWAGLMLPRFKCGHERTEENTIINRYMQNGQRAEQPRCRFCHNQHNSRYRRKR